MKDFLAPLPTTFAFLKSSLLLFIKQHSVDVKHVHDDLKVWPVLSATPMCEHALIAAISDV